MQGEKRKIDFQDSHHNGHLGFLIGTILAIFDLQVTPILPTDFHVNWPFESGEEAIFYLEVTTILPTKFQVNWPIVDAARWMMHDDGH